MQLNNQNEKLMIALQKKGSASTQPKQERSKARVQAIFDAANTLLKKALSEGDADLLSISTTSIAKEAGIPVGSVYQYFEDKNNILGTLFQKAYKSIESIVIQSYVSIDFSQPLRGKTEAVLQVFWLAAVEHPTYRALTRWAVRQDSGNVWGVTHGLKKDYIALISQALSLCDLDLSEKKQDAVVATMAVTISSLVNQAIEETNEDRAALFISELATIISAYLDFYQTSLHK